MRKIFKTGACLWVAATLLLGGCSRPAVESTQSYTIHQQKVKLSPPKDWKVRQEKSPDSKDPKEIAAVIFEPPQGRGHIAVTVTEGVAQTQEFMDRLGNGISARQGKILQQWYEHKFDEPDKENAYHMEYELRDAGPSAPVQKGMQVQIFTQKKVLYSLVFTADPAVYDANRATFLALVKSFELEP